MSEENNDKIEMTKKDFDEEVTSQVEKAAVSIREEITDAVKTSIADAIEPVDKRIELIEVKDKEQDPTSGFKHFGEFAMAVKEASVPGGTLDERLKAAGDPTTTVAAPSALGVLIPTAFVPNLFKIPVTDEGLKNRCTSIPIPNKSVEYPYLDGFDQSGGLVHGGIAWYNTAELAQMTATNPEAGMLKLALNKLTGMHYSSDELLQFSGISIEPLINAGFRDGLNFKINDSIINGTGAGQGLGIMNSPCVLEVSAETGQESTTIIAENVMNMYARQYNKANSVWIMIHDAAPQLDKMTLAVGTGGSAVFMPMGGLSNAPFDTLRGRPIIYSDHCQALGTPGDIILADLSVMHYGEATSGIQASTSIHLKFDYNQTAFKFIYYYDHQSWMKAKFTPLRGSTRSPFVTLASR